MPLFVLDLLSILRLPISLYCGERRRRRLAWPRPSRQSRRRLKSLLTPATISLRTFSVFRERGLSSPFSPRLYSFELTSVDSSPALHLLPIIIALCDKIGHHPSSARSISFSQNESPLSCFHISSRRGAILVLKGRFDHCATNRYI